MDIYFINKLMDKYGIDFNYAELIYLDLHAKNIVGIANEDIDKIDELEKFLKKYYKG